MGKLRKWGCSTSHWSRLISHLTSTSSVAFRCILGFVFARLGHDPWHPEHRLPSGWDNGFKPEISCANQLGVLPADAGEGIYRVVQVAKRGDRTGPPMR